MMFCEFFTEAAVTVCNNREQVERKRRTLECSTCEYFSSAKETFEQQTSRYPIEESEDLKAAR
jgi:hypothetical protein